MKADYKIVLGVAPTKRNDPAFASAKALENKVPLFAKLREMGIEFIDIDDVCPDGLLVTLDDVDAAAKKFKAAGVQALFIPSVMFGAEPAVAFLAKELNVPTLIWGPRDPNGNLTNGKTQVGLFPIGRSLNLVKVPFTYITSCYLEDPLFERGVRTFIDAVRIAEHFKHARILQVGTRPETFWSCIVNESELLTKFGIYTHPIEVSELSALTKRYMADEQKKCNDLVSEIKSRADYVCNEDVLYKSAAMKLALEQYITETRSTGVAIQCWYEMQKQLGIWPCTAGALLAEDGFPVSCETDILGAITMILSIAATAGKSFPFFADFSNRHPNNPNCEGAGHCSITPFSMFDKRPVIAKRLPPADQNWGGGVTGRIAKSDKMTFMRFENDNGQYKILLGNAVGRDGPDFCQPAAVGWFEVENWPKLEHKLVTGPYTHHIALINEDIVPAMNEAIRYMPGVQADFAFESDKERAESFFYTE